MLDARDNVENFGAASIFQPLRSSSCRQVAYQSLSQLSSPSPTLSPASSFPQLSVLNMIESENSVNTRLHLMPTITPISARPLQIMPAYSNCCPPILNDAYLVLINAIHF